MDDRPPPKGLGETAKGSSRRWGRNYDNRELFPPFGVSDYESLLTKLAETSVSGHTGMNLNKRAYVVWHELPDELVINAESFYCDVW